MHAPFRCRSIVDFLVRHISEFLMFSFVNSSEAALAYRLQQDELSETWLEMADDSNPFNEIYLIYQELILQ